MASEVPTMLPTMTSRPSRRASLVRIDAQPHVRARGAHRAHALGIEGFTRQLQFNGLRESIGTGIRRHLLWLVGSHGESCEQRLRRIESGNLPRGPAGQLRLQIPQGAVHCVARTASICVTTPDASSSCR
jgi:hypothetical protein